MNNKLERFIDELQTTGKIHRFSDIIAYAQQQNIKLSKDEFLEAYSRNYRSGVFYTPNDIARLMANIGRIFRPKKILDPACGTGNILRYCNSGEEIFGYDTNGEAIFIAKWLVGRGDYYLEDFLSKDFNDKFDLVICHFPFGSRAKQDNRVRHSERLFLEKCLVLLSPEGVIVCLVPNNFLFGSYAAALRKRINNEYSLEMVINLPQTSLPHTFIETSVLLICNGPQRDNVYMAVYEKDISRILQNYQKQKGDIWVHRTKLDCRWDRHFHDPRFEEIEEKLGGKDVKKLSEMAEVRRGFSPRSECKKKKGKYLVFSFRNVKESALVHTERDQFVDDLKISNFETSILQEGDIVVNLLFNKRKLYTYKKGDMRAVVTHNYGIIRSRENQYIKTYLSSESGQKLFDRQAERRTRGSVISHLSLQDLANIRIPVLPLEDSNLIGESNLAKASKSEIEMLKEQIKERKIEDSRFQQEVIQRLERIEKKVDQILEVITLLQKDIEAIKATQRSEEEKLKIIYGKIDARLVPLREQLKDELKVYVEIVKDLVKNWEKLDILGKQVLPLAEYLYDKLIEIEDADYSPVVLEYCKCLENEFLRKLFVEFTNSINKAQKDLGEFLSTDHDNEKTKQFATCIKRYGDKPSEEMKYTLGQMSFILDLTAGENTLKTSPLLQEFKAFIIKYFRGNLILSKEYLRRIENIVENFRNKCAHSYKMGEQEALECKKRIPEDIDYFLDCWKD